MLSLTPRDRKRLEDLVAESQLTKNEAVRRALAVDHYLRKQLKQGNKVLIEQEDGTLRQVEFVD